MVDAHNFVMKDGKTRPNHVFREFLLKQFDAMQRKVSALDALISEVILRIHASIQITV